MVNEDAEIDKLYPDSNIDYIADITDDTKNSADMVNEDGDKCCDEVFSSVSYKISDKINHYEKYFASFEKPKCKENDSDSKDNNLNIPETKIIESLNISHKLEEVTEENDKINMIEPIH